MVEEITGLWSWAPLWLRLRPWAHALDSIVLVHGLRGHPKFTWEHTTVRKERSDLATKDKDRRWFCTSLSFWTRQCTEQREVETEDRPPSSDTQESYSRNTGSIYWPRDLLPLTIPNARIFTYGYNADIIGGLFQATSKNSISQHGQDLMVELEREIRNKVWVFYVQPSSI